MTNCSDVLGIAPDASLQEIKRAYARVLKSNRPDDDAEAFARVHAAFEACVARFKRREAGLPGEPDWFDDEDEDYAESGSAEPTTDASDGPPIPDGVVDPQVDAVSAEAGKVVGEIFDAAGTMLAQDFYAWLRSDERLYDLSFKREVGDQVIERLSEVADSLRWQTIAAIHEFFEVDSIADPRLRRDYRAREIWLRVEADARFEKSVRKMRGPYSDFADLTVMAELLEPQDRVRSIKMHLIPMLAGQLRSKFNELSAEDPERAEDMLSPQARDYWLPLTDPARLDPRRVGLALMHSAMVGVPFGFFVFAPKSLLKSLEASAWITGVIFSIWLAGALLKFAGARYSAWRMRAVGAGEAPAGSSMFADRVTAFAGTAAVISISLSILALHFEKVMMGMILQVWIVIAIGGLMFRVPRFRWEALLAAITISVCAYPYIRLFGPLQLDDAFYAAGPGAFSTGALAVLLFDAAHARLTRQALSDVRDAISIPLCILAAAAVLVAWFS